MTITTHELNNLPDCILLNIFKQCRSTEVIWRARIVCKRWYNLLADAELWRVSDLSSFKLDKPDLIETITSYVPIKDLQYLQIQHTVIPDNGLQIILKQALNLEGLSLYGSTVTSEKQLLLHQHHLSRHVGFVDIRNSKGNSDFMKNIIAKTEERIKVLGVSNSFGTSTEIYGKTFLHFLPNLTILECSDCVWMNDNVIREMSTYCRLLESLNINKCLNVIGTNLHLLIARCTKLKTLILRRTSVRNEEIIKPNWAHSNINELDLANCYYLDDEPVLHVVQDLAMKLEHLCCAVTDEIVLSITNKKLKLRSLELRRRHPLNEEYLVKFISKCEFLESLDVSLMPIEFEFFQQMLPKLSNLRWLHFAGHDILKTTEVLKLLSEHCWHLQQVGFHYYNAKPNQTQIHDAVLNFLQSSLNLQRVCIGGVHMEQLIKRVQATIIEKQLYELLSIEVCDASKFILPQSRNSVDNYAASFTH